MGSLQQFIKIAEDRINTAEIVSYGLGTDEDDDNYLYVETKTSDSLFEYYEDDVDFDLEEKIAELDEIFLVRKPGYEN